MIEVPTSVLSLFAAAGWRPGRRIRVPPSIPANHPAAEIVTEFGKLHVRHGEVAEECAPSDVVFHRPQYDELSFIPDVWGKLLGTQLIGVAMTDESYGALYVDASGRHFGANYINNDVFIFTAHHSARPWKVSFWVGVLAHCYAPNRKE